MRLATRLFCLKFVLSEVILLVTRSPMPLNVRELGHSLLFCVQRWFHKLPSDVQFLVWLAALDRESFAQLTPIQRLDALPAR